jgi:outer membrane immunogenic protein
MRREFVFSIGLLASVVAGDGSAVAADLPVKAPPPEAPAVVPDWVGFYVGIHGGGGWGHTSFEPAVFSNSPLLLAVAPPDASPKGGVFGGQVGYNWQWGPGVGGLEVDFSGADIKETSAFSIPIPLLTGFTFTREVKIDELASARGRLGYLIFPNLLLYGTAGIGWAHSRLNTTQLSGALVSSTSFTDEFGWVAGAGLEWRLWDHWLLRGEWLHYDFGRHNDNATPNFFFPGSASPPFEMLLNTRNTVDVARAALSYKF